MLLPGSRHNGFETDLPTQATSRTRHLQASPTGALMQGSATALHYPTRASRGVPAVRSLVLLLGASGIAGERGMRRASNSGNGKLLRRPIAVAPQISTTGLVDRCALHQSNFGYRQGRPNTADGSNIQCR